jgi:hypothetical protein
MSIDRLFWLNRYSLLSGQFEELNNKLVEIVTNVTHMKVDELAKMHPAERYVLHNLCLNNFDTFYSSLIGHVLLPQRHQQKQQ